MSDSAASDRHARFAELHRSGTFVLVNAQDVGSAVASELGGAQAIGTSSAAFAATTGRPDGGVTRSDVAEHVRQLVAATSVPVSVDAENGWSHEPGGVAETIAVMAEAGASGASIEDWSNDETIGTYDADTAVARIEAAVAAASAVGRPFTLCARADGFLHGTTDDDEIHDRLRRFADAGADCVYAPFVPDLGRVHRVLGAVDAPVNVLEFVGRGYGVDALADLGVRRISLGSSMTWASYGATRALVEQLLAGDQVELPAPWVTSRDIEAGQAG